MRVAFHAPLKAPDHPVPSGDRQMGRLLIAALRAGGHDVEVASTFRSFLSSPDPDRLRAVAAEAVREVERLARRFDGAGAPDLWFTYHSHYKAPDLLGPGLAARFGLPYALAEASHAGKRAAGPWAAWHAANEAAIRAADRHICFTPRDAAGLAGLVAPDRIVALPPFLAPGPFGATGREPRRLSPPADPLRLRMESGFDNLEAPRRSRESRHRSRGEGRTELVTVAMMRPGDKARSYAALAQALGGLTATCDWRLTVVGDGPERPAIAALFAGLAPHRLAWAGEQDAEGVAAILARSDLYVWPGFGEAYGMAYLEAAAAGLPVLAMDSGGVGSVVTHGVTGVLTPEGDVAGFGAALARLIADPAMRERLGEAGRRMVREERTVGHAAALLTVALNALAPRP